MKHELTPKPHFMVLLANFKEAMMCEILQYSRYLANLTLYLLSVMACSTIEFGQVHCSYMGGVFMKLFAELQTVQTKIRLLLEEEQSNFSLQCLPKYFPSVPIFKAAQILAMV